MVQHADIDHTGITGTGSAGAAVTETAFVARSTTGNTSYSTSFVDIVENSVTLEVGFTTGTTGIVVVNLYIQSSGAQARARLWNQGAAAVIANTYRNMVTSSSGAWNVVSWRVALTASTAYTIRPQIRATSGTLSVYSGPGTADGDAGPIECHVLMVQA